MIIIYCPKCDNEVNENDKFCNNCGVDLKSKVNSDDNINDAKKQNNKNLKKEEPKSNLINEKLTFIDRLAKFIIIIFTLFFPPIGILGIFNTKYFGKKSKIISSVWLGIFLIIAFNIGNNESDNNLATQQIQQEAVKDNTEKPQSILSTMINGSDDKKDYNAIIDFIDQNPTMGKFVYYEEISPWAKGKRYSVSTKAATYLFYLHNNNVVGVWAKDDNGIKHQIYHEDIPELPKNVERASTETLPKYTIIDQVDLMSGGRYGDILITSYSTKTPMDKRKKTLRAIMKKEGFTEASLYCTKEAYKANINSSYNESHPGVLDKGYLGGVLYDGKFHGPIN